MCRNRRHADGSARHPSRGRRTGRLRGLTRKAPRAQATARGYAGIVELFLTRLASVALARVLSGTPAAVAACAAACLPGAGHGSSRPADLQPSSSTSHVHHHGYVMTALQGEQASTPHAVGAVHSAPTHGCCPQGLLTGTSGTVLVDARASVQVPAAASLVRLQNLRPAGSAQVEAPKSVPAASWLRLRRASCFGSDPPHQGTPAPPSAPLPDFIPPVTEADRAAAFPELMDHSVHDHG